MVLEELGLIVNQSCLNNIRIQNAAGTASWYFEYVAEHKMAIYTASGYFTPEEIKHIYKFLSYHVYQHKMSVVRSVTDSREIEGSFHQMNEWFVKDFMPKVVAGGFRCNANIVSKDFYAQLAQEDLDEMIGGLFVQRQFEDYQKGYDWVTSQDVS